MDMCLSSAKKKSKEMILPVRDWEGVWKRGSGK